METEQALDGHEQEKISLLMQMSNAQDGAQAMELPTLDAEPEGASEPAAAAAGEEAPAAVSAQEAAPLEHLDAQERRVLELTTKRGLTLKEAYRAVYGSEPARNTQDASPATPNAAGAAPLAKRTARPVPAGGAAMDAPVAALERRVANAKSPGAMLELMREIGTPLAALFKK